MILDRRLPPAVTLGPRSSKLASPALSSCERAEDLIAIDPMTCPRRNSGSSRPYYGLAAPACLRAEWADVPLRRGTVADGTKDRCERITPPNLIAKRLNLPLPKSR